MATSLADYRDEFEPDGIADRRISASARLTPSAGRPRSTTLPSTFTEARRVTASSPFSRVAG